MQTIEVRQRFIGLRDVEREGDKGLQKTIDRNVSYLSQHVTYKIAQVLIPTPSLTHTLRYSEVRVMPMLGLLSSTSFRDGRALTDTTLDDWVFLSQCGQIELAMQVYLETAIKGLDTITSIC